MHADMIAAVIGEAFLLEHSTFVFHTWLPSARISRRPGGRAGEAPSGDIHRATKRGNQRFREARTNDPERRGSSKR